MNNEITAPKNDTELIAMAIRLYREGFVSILHPKLRDSLLDLFCREEEFAAAKHEVLNALDGIE